VRRAVALLLIAALVAAAGCGGEDRPGAARGAAERFLDGYVEPDGRVVRRDQGGDTVSEGQAYAMLLAAAIGDERRFDLAWTWARDHLRRPDGLLAWHWDDGQVVDGEPASDADLDAARALLLAARRFGRPSLDEEGRRLGDAIRRNEAVGDLVVAGPWARAEAVVNPSYLSPRAFDALGWRGASASARRALEGLKEPLPPDWARLDGHTLAPTGPPRSDEPAAYGYDAARLPLRLAESCAAEDRRLAARAWPALRDRDPLPAVLGLDGAPRSQDAHPVAAAGAAGAARAAGDRAAADDLLDRAEELEDERPSYYGAAWVALARVMLDSDWLGRCG
jgi:endo-1,4-beta-D-glucanase Y